MRKYEFERFIGGVELNGNDIEKRVAIDGSEDIRLVHNFKMKKISSLEMNKKTYEKLLENIPENLTPAGRLAYLLNRLFNQNIEY